MLLKAFQIKNYKSFVDSGKCSVQDGVTILAGQNESGKTGVLNALVKINDSVPSFEEDEFSFGNKEAPPEITYWFELSDMDLVELGKVLPEYLIDNEVVVLVRDKSRDIYCTHKNMYSVSDEGVSEEDDNDNVRIAINKSIEPLIPKFVLYKSRTDEIPDTFTVNDVSSLPVKRLGSYLDRDFTQIFSEKNQQSQKTATVSLSRAISKDFSEKYRQREIRLEFDMNNGRISFYVYDNKASSDELGIFPFRLSQRSDGLRWYLNFYIALKGEELRPGDIILVDEPGIYLHPKAQQEMRSILNEASKENQIIYTTHSPYLIDAENIGQVRLVEKRGVNEKEGYYEISEIKERIHHSRNIDTIKPIIDAIGYSLGSELNLRYSSVLICEGVSDYYYIKALERLMGTELGCGITHANGCNNIGKIALLFLGLGVAQIYALVDSDKGGIKERFELIRDGVFDENKLLTTHEANNVEKGIEDIFNREWFLKEIMEYGEDEIRTADEVLSKEVKKKYGGAKYLLAKSLYNKVQKDYFDKDTVLNQNGEELFEKLSKTIKDENGN